MKRILLQILLTIGLKIMEIGGMILVLVGFFGAIIGLVWLAAHSMVFRAILIVAAFIIGGFIVAALTYGWVSDNWRWAGRILDKFKKGT